MADVGDEKHWNAVYEARSSFVDQHLGTLPNDILKMMDMSGTWPGGGLYKFQADKLGADIWAYMTFGFTNPDMPTSVTPTDVQQVNEDGRNLETSLTLQQKENVPSYPGRLGYGYEVLILTRGEQDWPLAVLQWVVHTEMLNDVDILGRVEGYNGLTVEDIDAWEQGTVNILFQKARDPLPDSMNLPGGNPSLIVATTITDDEMRWSQQNGRDKLLTKLAKAGVGQISELARVSVINPKAVNLDKVTSVQKAQSLHAEGLLRKVYLFPLELGGPDEAVNIVYLPKAAALQKQLFDQQVMQAAERGLVKNYSATPEYRGKSVIPSQLVIQTSGEQALEKMIQVY